MSNSEDKPGEELNPAWLQRGERVGLYEVDRLVGSGGFGALYRVLRDGQEFALKIPLARVSELAPEERRQHEERIMREVVSLMSLSHPNIVRVRAFDRWPDPTDGYLYLVMDFVAGSPLHTWRARQTPSVLRIGEVFKRIAEAVGEMHRLSIFHRDLKSDNVLVRASDAEPVIVDFGIARPRSAYTVTKERAVIGTYTHWAPEWVAFWDSQAFLDGEKLAYLPTADLHAVGYMLYECLTGRPPFNAEHEGQLLKQIQHLVPPPPSSVNPNVPSAFDEIAQKLLAKRPEDRYQSGQELASALGAVLERAGEGWNSPLDVPSSTQGPTNEGRGRANSAAARASATPLPLSAAGGALPLISIERLPTKPPPAPVSAAPFNPPSTEGRAFVSPEDDAAPLAASTAVAQQLPSALREAKEKLAAASAAQARRHNLPYAALGALALVCLGVLALASLGSRDEAPKPQSLLQQVEAAAPATAKEPLPPQPGVALAPEPLPTEAQAGAGAPPPPAAKAPGNDSERIDALLANSYGRPGAPRAAPASGPSWLHRGQRVESAPKASPKPGLGIPLGARLRVRLSTNLDSRTVSLGPVEAVLLRPYSTSSGHTLPSRTMVYGDASAAEGRFSVRFTSLRLPDNTEVPFKGLALDLEENKSGLRASRRLAAAPAAGPGVAEAVAKGAASTLLGKVGADTAGELARGAGQTALSATGPGNSGASAVDALLLDSGVDFDIFVEASF